MIRYWLTKIGVGLGLYWLIQAACLNPWGGWIFLPLLFLVTTIGAIELWVNTQAWRWTDRHVAISLWLLGCVLFADLYRHNPLYTLLVVFYGAGYDVGGLIFGKLFDPQSTRPILPVISPRKTWAGTVGGIATGWICGLSVWLAYLPPPRLPLEDAIASILGGTIAACLGDFLASWLKRSAELRHSGDRLPPLLRLFAGHGGMIDRCLSVVMGGLWFALINTFFP